jgi:hypothetical protein
VLLLLFIIGVATGGKDTKAASEHTAAATTTAVSTTTQPAATTSTTPAEPAATIAEAQNQIDSDYYAAAIAIRCPRSSSALLKKVDRVDDDWCKPTLVRVGIGVGWGMSGALKDLSADHRAAASHEARGRRTTVA